MRNLMRFILKIIISIITIACVPKNEQRGLSVFKDIDALKIEGKVRDFTQMESDAVRIKVPTVHGKKLLEISEIADSISLIPLSNEPEAVIGTINKIIIKDNIYVLDRYKTKSLKVFDCSGTYIATVGKNGEGPDEYAEPTDFLVTEVDIQIYDQFKQRIMFFDLNGKLLRNKKVPFMLIKFHRFAPNHYIFHSLDADNDHLASIVNYSIFETDSNFVVKNKGFYREKGLYTSYLNETNFTSGVNEVYYHPPFSDTIYSISKTGEFKDEFILDFGKRKLPKHYLLDKNNKRFLRESNENNYAFFCGDFFVLGRKSLFFTFTIGNTVNYCLFNNEKNIKIGNYTRNNFNYAITFSNIVGNDKNSLIGYVHTMDVLDMYEKITKDGYWKINSYHAQLIERLKSEDNPVLVLYHLKK